ncbi:MAG TPA: hypothetical protein VNW47_04475 [Terriglobales bacterium]|jgi:hypothetical protein|nr:hypothetical protein [Terriglobales bacterium]
MDEGRKRVLGIMAAILAARKLSQYQAGPKMPATICAIGDAVIWAKQIMEEIDHRWTTSKPND